MDIIQLLVVLVVVGVVLWLVESYVPMSPPIKTVLRVVVVLILCLWLLRIFGIWSGTLAIRGLVARPGPSAPVAAPEAAIPRAAGLRVGGAASPRRGLPEPPAVAAPATDRAAQVEPPGLAPDQPRLGVPL